MVHERSTTARSTVAVALAAMLAGCQGAETQKSDAPLPSLELKQVSAPVAMQPSPGETVEVPVALRWQGLNTNAAPPATKLALSATNAWHETLDVALRVVCLGVVQEPVVLSLGEHRLGAGQTAKLAVQVAQLPLQSTLELLQLRGEASYRRPAASRSKLAATPPVFYRHEPGYAAARFFDSEAFVAKEGGRTRDRIAADGHTHRVRVKTSQGTWRDVHADDEMFIVRGPNGEPEGRELYQGPVSAGRMEEAR